jgi:hypothetical protein
VQTPANADELARYGPHWCLFWGDAVAPYMFEVWYPRLLRSRLRYAILSGVDEIPDVVREKVRGMPNCVVLEPYVETKRWLRAVPTFEGFLHVDTRREVYTVVNAFRSASHVWIGHGESEKRVNLHRTVSLYDAVFLGRYADVRRAPRAIRRWVAHGACAIGGTIVEGATKDPWVHPRSPRTVLYAPSWEGTRDSVDYSSIPEVVPHLLDALPELTERGVRIIVRPHPRTGARSPDHLRLIERLVAAGATRGGEKGADFTAADLMIGDVSGVTSEFLFTEKPGILPVSDRLTGIGKSPTILEREYPWLYRWDPAHGTLPELLDELAAHDPLRRARAGAARRTFRGHRSIEEAARTFDVALTAPRWRRSRIPIPLRWVFEGKLALAALRRALSR